MFFHKIKYNITIFFCILLMLNGCNKENKKFIVENKEVIELKKQNNEIPSNEIIAKDKILKKEITSKDDNVSNNNNIIFEFRTERLLHGRNIQNDVKQNKTNKALSAVLKMFKNNLSSSSTELNLKDNSKVSTFNRYIFETNEVLEYENILVFLPLTGQYSNFGNKIRNALDLSILKLGNNNVKIIYFDTGKTVDQKIITSLFERLKPRFVIGPFTREVLLKIKPVAKKISLPILTFSNDIAMVENDVWSLGFSPEEQVESVISCALMHGYKRFGVIAPDNLYGKIITSQAQDLVSLSKKNYFDSIFLSNNLLNDKTDLYSALKRFLQYSENQDLHSKFDTILLSGRKEFILEIAPLLAFFNVDSRYIRILGTEKFNSKEIKNEPSLEKSWFPIISSKNDNKFKTLWRDIWGGNIDYFANAGFDSGIIGMNYINNFDKTTRDLENVVGPITGLVLGKRGYVAKPIQVMQIEDLEKLTNIKKCNKFKD